MGKIKFFILLVGFVTSSVSFSQSLNENLIFELSVLGKFNRLKKATKDDLRILINDSIYKEIKDWIHNKETFDYELDTLNSIGYLKSDDGNVKIITWNLPMMEGYNHFFGFVQFKEKDIVKTVELKFKEDAQLNLGEELTYPNNWYGALYYQIIVTKNKGENIYTLLGYIPNDLFTSKKIIDVLNISADGFVTLGKPIFKTNESVKKKLIFEYSARAVMKLSYNAKMDMIVYDHLSPSSPNYTGRFQFYGPDFSYDGLKFEKGFWQEYQNIEIEY